MIRPNALSLSPNTEFDDVTLAAKVMLNPFSWKNDTYVSQFENEFEKIFGNTYRAIAVNSGRSALHVILEAFNLPIGSEVVVQAFTCVVVPNAILANKFIPIYVDIDDSYNIDARKLRDVITKKTRAVVVQHTFGIPADMVAIKRVIKEKEATFKTKIYLIEDCAHSLGSTYKKNKIGTLGDTSFFSFGRDKVVSSVFGGIILTKDKALTSRVKTIVSALKEPSRIWIFQQLMHPLLFNLIILPLYAIGVGKVTLGKSLLFIFQKSQLLSKPVYPDELKAKNISLFPQKMSGALARLALNQLPKLDKFTQKRRNISLQYFQAGLNLNSTRFTDLALLRYPISVEYPKEVTRYAKVQGLLLGDWYRNVLDPKCDVSVFGYKKGSCPHAEFLASRVVNLPTYPTMKQSDVDTVIQILKKWKSTQ